jgi:hypothetical protein
MKRGAVRRRLAAVLGVIFAVFIVTMAFLLGRARTRHTAISFTPREVEQAQREVLPYRQSGLIFHWADDRPTVYVMRSWWEGLSLEARREMGRAMAVAKSREQITIYDETLKVRLAICTAKGRCALPAND